MINATAMAVRTSRKIDRRQITNAMIRAKLVIEIPFNNVSGGISIRYGFAGNYSSLLIRFKKLSWIDAQCGRGTAIHIGVCIIVRERGAYPGNSDWRITASRHAHLSIRKASIRNRWCICA
ncbi:hypothetical protein Y032_0167g113 [Ancylostoma ceylanicum]|nr:hypothetical protein Y032_0167g113 [Ancylostoma ceylanicum]